MGNGNGTTGAVKVLGWAGGFTIFLSTVVGVIYQTVYAPLSTALAKECDMRLLCDEKIVVERNLILKDLTNELKSIGVTVNNIHTEQSIMKTDLEYIKRKVQI